MSSLNELHTQLQARALAGDRRLDPQNAAKYLGTSKRTLENWRATWTSARRLGRPELRRGPRFRKVSEKRVLYSVADLDHFKSTYHRWLDGTAVWVEPA